MEGHSRPVSPSPVSDLAFQDDSSVVFGYGSIVSFTDATTNLPIRSCNYWCSRFSTIRFSLLSICVTNVVMRHCSAAAAVKSSLTIAAVKVRHYSYSYWFDTLHAKIFHFFDV